MLSPGLHEIPEDQYFALPLISKSGLDLIAKSPATYRHWKTAPRRQTASMAIGSAVHKAILEPWEFDDVYALQPKFDGRTTLGKQSAAEWAAKNPTRTPLQPDDFATILAMRDAVAAHRIAGNVFSAGAAEQSLIWDHADTGARCKSRLDWLKDDTLVDLKTTDDASLDEFQRSIAKYRYHVQMAFYLDGLKSIGLTVPYNLLVVVESKPPYHVATYTFDEDTLTEGRFLYTRDLEIHTECVRTGKWPGLPEIVQTISLPKWYKKGA